jgi:hypothetical protein
MNYYSCEKRLHQNRLGHLPSRKKKGGEKGNRCRKNLGVHWFHVGARRHPCLGERAPFARVSHFFCVVVEGIVSDRCREALVIPQCSPLSTCVIAASFYFGSCSSRPS